MIALQSLISERAPRHIAGLIMSVPTTYAVALFFMGWVLGPHAVADAFDGVPLGLGASFFFLAIYIAIANRIHRSFTVTAFVSAVLSVAIWFVISIPFVLRPDPSLPWSIVGYIVLISLTHYLVAICPKIHTEPVAIHFTHRQVAIRSIVAGTLIGIIVILGKAMGPLIGGLFSIFPVAYMSTCLMVHHAHGPKKLYHVFHTACFGSVAFLLYGYATTITFPSFGIWIGTALAYVPAVLYLVILQKILQSQG